MEKLELNKMIEDNLKVGMIFDNPGGGTSEIVASDRAKPSRYDPKGPED